MITKDTIKSDLTKLGIIEGDMLFVRISYRAIGKVDGGPKTVIDAILETIGEQGTLLATAFPPRVRSYSRWLHKDNVYKPGVKPITGVIPVIMCSYPNAHLSSHPISPYVAIGKDAELLTKSHTPEKDSYDIVRMMIDKFHPKCLRIGGNVLDGTAHLAFTEGLVYKGAYQTRLPEGTFYIDNGVRKWKERKVSAFCYTGFQKFFNDHILNQPDTILSEGNVGNGKAVVTSMKATYDIEKRYIGKAPETLLCDSPTCLMCRLSYTYSDTSIAKYVLKSIPRLFSTNWKHELGAYRTILVAKLFGKKCL